jgi:hypothetical protein
LKKLFFTIFGKKKRYFSFFSSAASFARLELEGVFRLFTQPGSHRFSSFIPSSLYFFVEAQKINILSLLLISYTTILLSVIISLHTVKESKPSWSMRFADDTSL